jgi:DNA-binding IscR family transcriptional regulator
MWDRVQNAIYNVYDHTTIQDLLDNESGLQMIADTMPGKQRHARS